MLFRSNRRWLRWHDRAGGSDKAIHRDAVRSGGIGERGAFGGGKVQRNLHGLGRETFAGRTRGEGAFHGAQSGGESIIERLHG